MFAIGDASRLSGVSIETIRYYEREGIVGKPARTASGRRIYGEDEIAQLRFIRRCRNLGFSISEVLSLRDLSENPGNACAAVEQLGQVQLENVRVKIAELRRLEKALGELLSNCSRGKTECPMLGKLMGYTAH